MAERCGFKVVKSFSLGIDPATDLGFRNDPTYQALPLHSRIDLECRQFVFWLRPDTSLDANDSKHGFYTSKLASDESILEKDGSSENKKERSLNIEDRGALAEKMRDPTVAVAIITSSPVQDERLRMVEFKRAEYLSITRSKSSIKKRAQLFLGVTSNVCACCFNQGC